MERIMVPGGALARAMLLTVPAFLAGCDDGLNSSQSRENPRGLKADEYIVLSSEAFGCKYPGKFAEALEHYNRRELSAWANIVTDEPYCFSVSNYPSPPRWVVLQIRGGAMQVGLAGVSEYEKMVRHNSKYQYANDIQFWTMTKWGEKYADTHAEFVEKSRAEAKQEAQAQRPTEAQPKLSQQHKAKNAPSTNAKQAAAPTSETKFIVQVAALASEGKVLEVQDKLRSAGISSYTEKGGSEDMPRIRVRIGPFTDKGQADKVRAKLSKIGLAGTLVPI